MKKQLLKISELEFDDDLYPRTSLSDLAAYRYSQAMKAGSKFPPIIVGVFKGKNFVLDGWHRVEATKKLKQDYIEGKVKVYTSRREMFVDAVNFNADHGVQLTPNDQVKIINKLEEYKFNPEEIQNIVKVPLDAIEKFKARVVIGPNGKPIYLKGAIAKTMASDEDKIRANETKLTVRSFDNLLIQLIGLLRNNIYTETEKTENLLSELMTLLQSKLGLTVEA